MLHQQSTRRIALGVAVCVAGFFAGSPCQAADGQAATTRLALRTRDRGDFVVEAVRKRAAGAVGGEVRLIDRDAPCENQKLTRILCVVPWAGDFPDAPWVFRHHHGLVTAFCGDRLMAVGHAPKEPIRRWVGKTQFPPPDQAFFQKCGTSEPLEVVGWSLEQLGSPVACLAVAGSASPSYRTGLAPVWVRNFARNDVARLTAGPNEVADLRLRIDRFIQEVGQDLHVHRDFEAWEKADPQLRELQDTSLTAVAQVFGTRHHYYGETFSVMSKLCEIDPAVRIGIRPGFSERMRLDTVYDFQARRLPKGSTPPDRVEYWQKLAREEFERFAGREHPDTVRVLQDRARRLWQVSGPKEAEATLRDAFDRSATLLSDSVLAGLPEAQAYQFRAANPPPLDPLLSCYRVARRDRGRDAYEAVWRVKALATRRLVGRQQLLQAAAGRPEVRKLADELRTTREQLARLSLSVPPEAAAAVRRHAAWVTLGKADEVDRWLDTWAAAIRPGGRPEEEVAAQLRRRLWGPIEDSLAGCDRVILIPDGKLAHVPWAALPGRKPGTYLLGDYALAQAPYGQHVVRTLTEPPPEGDTFLVAGGIDYGLGGKWAYLGGTAAEAEQLEKLRRGPGTVRLGGEGATKSRLRELMPGRRHIHLATHGDRGLPVGSDGFLTAEEVTGLDLSRTEMVVLSACETGVGRGRAGEGTFSLQRAFHVAGARAVVASLWKVPDAATQSLMVRFYENLWRGRGGKPMGKLEALREAKLWLMRDARVTPELLRSGLTPESRLEWKPGDPVPPYYWAAFAVSGDWR